MPEKLVDELTGRKAGVSTSINAPLPNQVAIRPRPSYTKGFRETAASILGLVDQVGGAITDDRDQRTKEALLAARRGDLNRSEILAESGPYRDFMERALEEDEGDREIQAVIAEYNERLPTMVEANLNNSEGLLEDSQKFFNTNTGPREDENGTKIPAWSRDKYRGATASINTAINNGMQSSVRIQRSLLTNRAESQISLSIESKLDSLHLSNTSGDLTLTNAGILKKISGEESFYEKLSEELGGIAVEQETKQSARRLALDSQITSLRYAAYPNPVEASRRRALINRILVAAREAAASGNPWIPDSDILLLQKSLNQNSVDYMRDEESEFLRKERRETRRSAEIERNLNANHRAIERGEDSILDSDQADLLNLEYSVLTGEEFSIDDSGLGTNVWRDIRNVLNDPGIPFSEKSSLVREVKGSSRASQHQKDWVDNFEDTARTRAERLVDDPVGKATMSRILSSTWGLIQIHLEGMSNKKVPESSISNARMAHTNAGTSEGADEAIANAVALFFSPNTREFRMAQDNVKRILSYVNIAESDMYVWSLDNPNASTEQRSKYYREIFDKSKVSVQELLQPNYSATTIISKPPREASQAVKDTTQRIKDIITRDRPSEVRDLSVPGVDTGESSGDAAIRTPEAEIFNGLSPEEVEDADIAWAAIAVADYNGDPRDVASVTWEGETTAIGELSPETPTDTDLPQTRGEAAAKLIQVAGVPTAVNGDTNISPSTRALIQEKIPEILEIREQTLVEEALDKDIRNLTSIIEQLTGKAREDYLVQARTHLREQLARSPDGSVLLSTEWEGGYLNVAAGVEGVKPTFEFKGDELDSLILEGVFDDIDGIEGVLNLGVY